MLVNFTKGEKVYYIRYVDARYDARAKKLDNLDKLVNLDKMVSLDKMVNLDKMSDEIDD